MSIRSEFDRLIERRRGYFERELKDAVSSRDAEFFDRRFFKTISQVKLTDHEFRRIASIRRARHADVACLPTGNVARVVEPKRSSHGRRSRSCAPKRGPQSNRVLLRDHKNMVGRVLTNRNVVKRDSGEYVLLGIRKPCTGSSAAAQSRLRRKTFRVPGTTR